MCLHYSRQTAVHIIYSLNMSCKADRGPVSIPPSAVGFCFVFDRREEGSLFPCRVPQTVCRDAADAQCKVCFICKPVDKPVEIPGHVAHLCVDSKVKLGRHITPSPRVPQVRMCLPLKSRAWMNLPATTSSRFLWKPVLNAAGALCHSYLTRR